MPLLASLQLGTIFIIVVLVALPLGALVFAMGAGNALEKIGKGDFALEQDFPQSSGGPRPRGSPPKSARRRSGRWSRPARIGGWRRAARR